MIYQENPWASMAVPTWGISQILTQHVYSNTMSPLSQTAHIQRYRTREAASETTSTCVFPTAVRIGPYLNMRLHLMDGV